MILVPINPLQACISVQKVWFQKEWRRILYAPFFHASDFHLYYNMASFIWKGISLEKHFGSGYFLYLISVFSVATNLVYLGINFALAEFLDQWSAMQSCAVGFSGVLFALKVVSTHIQPPGMTRVLGFIPVPMRLACWVELVLISVLFPNVSFVGHLSGILVGLAWVYGPLRMAMDVPLSVVNGTYPIVLTLSNIQHFVSRVVSTRDKVKPNTWTKQLSLSIHTTVLYMAIVPGSNPTCCFTRWSGFHNPSPC